MMRSQKRKKPQYKTDKTRIGGSPFSRVPFVKSLRIPANSTSKISTILPWIHPSSQADLLSLSRGFKSRDCKGWPGIPKFFFFQRVHGTYTYTYAHREPTISYINRFICTIDQQDLIRDSRCINNDIHDCISFFPIWKDCEWCTRGHKHWGLEGIDLGKSRNQEITYSSCILDISFYDMFPYIF